MELYYFAYGSNLSLARLRERAPGARRLGSFQLAAHELRFHKIGRDGSGKCDAWYSGDQQHAVHGAVFVISAAEKHLLDRAEGLGIGYAEKTVSVRGPGELDIEAFTYCALQTRAGLKPYSWYLHHVLTGARESGLPADYIRGLQDVQTLEDPDRLRDARERALHSDARGAAS